MRSNLLGELNEAQQKAVITTEGPLLVLAGAGTGKTRVITYRIANLLLRGVAPESILAVTFTNKAAREMRQRVSALTQGRKPRGLTLSTFHSLGVRILRAEAKTLGLRDNFTIYDSSDQVSLLRTVLRDIKGPVSAGDARGVLAKISLAKNRFASPEDLIDEATDEWEYLIGRTYVRYQESLQRLNCVDFDDLILLPVKLLQSSDEIREKYQRRYRYLLVDEYQDTNGSQYRFTHALVGPQRNICVVGDDDQSIYGFRGAEMDKILGFEQDFPGAKVVRLEQNYRSTASILGLANAVIAQNSERHDKRLRTSGPTGTPVRWLTVPGSEEEVDWIVRQILDLTLRDGRHPGDIAILLRSAIQARPFEEKLRLRRIPYKLVGGQSYFDRKEIRDAIAYWHVAHNPSDDMSLLRVINTPRRGIGNTTVGKLDEMSRKREISLYQALRLAADGEGSLTNKARSAAGALVSAFQAAREKERLGRYEDMCRGLLDAVSYRDALTELYSDPLTIQSRWSAIESLLESVKRFESRPGGESFGAFLGALALDDADQENEADNKPTGLTLQTLHSAKGLEYPVVFLPGIEEEILPHRRSVEDGDHAIEEERRLLYVGITRARERLFMTTATSRRAYGRDHPRRPSRFLTELADQDLWESSGYTPLADASQDAVQGHLAAYRRMKELQDR